MMSYLSSSIGLVSVVVPIYNGEKYLRECIESVLNQTYVNLELILIDDGSSDLSAFICESYLEDNRILLLTKENEGLTVARQMGINISKGEYLVMLDADDFLHKLFLEKMINSMRLSLSDIVVCQFQSFDLNRNKQFLHDITMPESYQIQLEDIQSKLKYFLGNFYMADSWSKLYRKQFILDSGVAFTLPRLYNGTDSLFNYKLFLHSPKIAVLRESLYFHRIHDESRVHRKGKLMQEGFFVLFKELTDELNKLNIGVSNFQKSLIDVFWSLMVVSFDDLMNHESFKIVSYAEFRRFNKNASLFISDYSRKMSVDLSRSLKYEILRFYFTALMFILLRRLVSILRINCVKGPRNKSVPL